jgi:hypothetical protein
LRRALASRSEPPNAGLLCAPAGEGALGKNQPLRSLKPAEITEKIWKTGEFHAGIACVNLLLDMAILLA